MPRNKIVKYIEPKKLNDQKQGEQEEKVAEKSDKTFEIKKLVNTDLSFIDTINLNKEEKEVVREHLVLQKENIPWVMEVIKKKRQNSDEKKAKKKLEEFNEKTNTGIYDKKKYMLEQKCRENKEIMKLANGVREARTELAVTKFNNKKQIKTISSKVIEELVKLREKIYEVDYVLRQEMADEDSILNSERSKKYSNLFKSGVNCNKLNNGSPRREEDFLKCLVEQGMLYATAMWAKLQADTIDNEIMNVLERIVAEDDASKLYNFSEMLQNCLGKIQVKMFTNNYKLDDREIQLLHLMQQLPIVEVIRGEQSVLSEDLMTEIGLIVADLENDMILYQQLMKRERKNAQILYKQFKQHEDGWYNSNEVASFIFLIFVFYLLATSTGIDKSLNQTVSNTWGAWGLSWGSNFTSVLNKIESYAPMIYYATIISGTWGLAKILGNGMTRVPLITKVVYTPQENRITTIAQTFKRAEVRIQKRLAIRQTTGVFILSRSMSIAFFVLTLQLQYQQSISSTWMSIGTGIITAVATWVGLPEGQNKALTGIVNLIGKKQEIEQNIERRIKIGAMRGVHDFVIDQVKRASIIDENTQSMLKQSFKKDQEYALAAAGLLNEMVGMDIEFYKELKQIMIDSKQLEAQSPLLTDKKALQQLKDNRQLFLKDEDEEIKKLLDKSDANRLLIQNALQRTSNKLKPVDDAVKQMLRLSDKTNIGSGPEIERMELFKMFSLFSNSKTSNLFKDHLKF